MHIAWLGLLSKNKGYHTGPLAMDALINQYTHAISLLHRYRANDQGNDIAATSDSDHHVSRISTHQLDIRGPRPGQPLPTAQGVMAVPRPPRSCPHVQAIRALACNTVRSQIETISACTVI